MSIFIKVKILKNIKFHKTGNRIRQMCSLGELAFELPEELELKSDTICDVWMIKMKPVRISLATGGGSSFFIQR